MTVNVPIFPVVCSLIELVSILAERASERSGSDYDSKKDDGVALVIDIKNKTNVIIFIFNYIPE